MVSKLSAPAFAMNQIYTISTPESEEIQWVDVLMMNYSPEKDMIATVGMCALPGKPDEPAGMPQVYDACGWEDWAEKW